MLILGVLTILVIIGIVLIGWDTYGEDIGILGATLIVFCGGALIVLAVGVPLNRMRVRANLVERDEVQRTHARARAENRGVELAAIQKDVAEWNGWLARTKYWNHTAWDIWTPDEVDAVKPIE